VFERSFIAAAPTSSLAMPGMSAARSVRLQRPCAILMISFVVAGVATTFELVCARTNHPKLVEQVIDTAIAFRRRFANFATATRDTAAGAVISASATYTSVSVSARRNTRGISDYINERVGKISLPQWKRTAIAAPAVRR